MRRGSVLISAREVLWRFMCSHFHVIWGTLFTEIEQTTYFFAGISGMVEEAIRGLYH